MDKQYLVQVGDDCFSLERDMFGVFSFNRFEGNSQRMSVVGLSGSSVPDSLYDSLGSSGWNAYVLAHAVVADRVLNERGFTRDFSFLSERVAVVLKIDEYGYFGVVNAGKIEVSKPFSLSGVASDKEKELVGALLKKYDIDRENSIICGFGDEDYSPIYNGLKKLDFRYCPDNKEDTDEGEDD